MTTFVAEIGVNHNGNPQEAFYLVEQAAKAGAEVVKFQLWQPGTKPELEPLYLASDILLHCKKQCDDLGVEFLCTPFDVYSLSVLTSKFRVQRIKLASTAIFNRELLQAAERANCPILLSTGLANEREIEQALRTIRYAPNVTLLHCVSCYPTPPAQANLKAIRRLAEAFGGQIGYSDHTGNPLAIYAATALSACLIEMHVTRSRDQEGPDHRCSYTPEMLSYTIAHARTVETMLGNGDIRPQECALPLRRQYA